MSGKKMGILAAIIGMLFLFVCCTNNIAASSPLIEMKRGSELFVNIKGIESGTWSSDDEEVITVADTGSGYLHLSALSEGVAAVKNMADGKTIKEYRVHVTGSEMKDFSFKDGNTLYIDLSESEDCQIQLTDVSSETLIKEYTFEIENRSYAEVTENGLIRGRRKGVTKVTVTHKASGLKKTANVIVVGSRNEKYLKTLDTDGTGTGNHVQGVTSDAYGDYFYYSFTDRLIKQTAGGEVVGSVTGFSGKGHLGDVSFNEEDGRVYASYVKNIVYDLPSLASVTEKNCYVLIFDVDKITEMNMSPDDIVTCVYVGKPVIALASAQGTGTYGDLLQLGGKYGVLNSIDSIEFGPAFGKPDGKKYLTLGLGAVANSAAKDGVSAKMRGDNDYIVLAQFDVLDWGKYELPYASIAAVSGPDSFDETYFYYFGYHDYGIQNIMYDEYEQAYFLSAYGLSNDTGDVQFPNYMLYILDASKSAEEKKLIGNGEDKGLVVKEKYGILHEESGIRGYGQSYSVGMRSMGDGYYYIAFNYNTEKNGQGARIKLFKWNLNTENKETATAPIVAVET